MLAVQSGVAYQTQRGNDVTVESGDGIVCDCGYAGGLHMATGAQFLSLKVPRHRIASLLPRVGRLAGMKTRPRPGRPEIAVQRLSAESQGADLSAGGRAARLYDEHIVDLDRAGARRPGRRPRAESWSRSASVEDPVRALGAILREIENGIDDPTLSATSIAGRLGITPRYVRLLLEQTGRSFSEHLLEKRLDRAAAGMRDPHQQGRKDFTAIASECGFGDLSYFNGRVFRRRYGQERPSDVRAKPSGARQSRG